MSVEHHAFLAVLANAGAVLKYNAQGLLPSAHLLHYCTLPTCTTSHSLCTLPLTTVTFALREKGVLSFKLLNSGKNCVDSYEVWAVEQ